VCSEVELELLAEEDGGLRVVVVAGAVGVSGGEVEVDGGVEIVLGIEIEPLEAFATGMIFDSLHEGVGQFETAIRGTDVEALDLGCGRDLGQRAEHYASGRLITYVGHPDGRIGAGEVVLEGRAVIADNDSDGIVVFLDEGECGIGLTEGGTANGDGWRWIH
jgi:hypothetical protein